MSEVFHRLEEEGTSENYPSRRVGFYVPRSRVFIYVVLFTCVFFILVILAIFLALGKPKYKHINESTKEPIVVTPGPSTVPVPTTAGQEPYWNVRLPNNIIPNHYELTLDIDLNDLKFSGNVDIHVKVIEPTFWVLVHVNLMTVTTADIYSKGSNEALATERKFEFKKNQFYVFRMQNKLSNGNYVIKMAFKAPLTDDLAGLYRSTYKHKNGTSVTIATTQFQPTDARRAFPCFDEPALKATFKVSIIHDQKFIALSNMPIVTSVKDEGSRIKDEFNITKIMPTYLLAFVVCDFDYKENITANGVKMRVYATKDQIDQVDYALRIGSHILDYFEVYFNITYPLPKADMIAIPDFSAGAMENWGLITYRESALLYDPKQSSESNKQRVALVVSHELAHQWFGNLVTMEWWNDLWLNEGFASFVENLGMASYHPDWNMDDQAVINYINTAFSLDSRMSSHPVSVPVHHPDEINEIFDSISYSKGAAIIRMLRDIIGEEIFREGLTSYLLKYEYGNAETKDLWEALSKVAAQKGKPVNVSKVMNTWTLQMGFPVVNVTDIGNGKVRISQDRFLQDPNANVSDTKYTSPYGYRWNVLFKYTVSNKKVNSKGTGSEERTWLNSTGDYVDIPMNTSSQWIKGNVGQKGYFRVNYDVQNWNDLAEQLLTYHQAIEPSDRAGMIKDAFSLARAKRLKYSLALDLTKYMSKEEEYVPFDASVSGLDYISEVVSRTRPTYKDLQKYKKKQCMKIYDKLGFEPQSGDSHLETYLRSKVLNVMCDVSHQPCLDNCTRLFKDWMEKDKQIPADVRSLVYYYGIAQGGAEEWDWLFEKFRNTTVASEKYKILYALAGTREPWLLSRYLEYSLDPSYIKSQDTRTVIGYIANYNPIGRHMAWDFIRLNWNKITERFGQGFQFTIRSIVFKVASNFNTEYELQQVKKFFELQGLSSQSDKQALEEIRSNIGWLKNHEKEVGDWLADWLKNN